MKAINVNYAIDAFKENMKAGIKKKSGGAIVKTNLILNYLTAFDWCRANKLTCAWGRGGKAAQIISLEHNFHAKIKSFNHGKL